MQVKSLCSEIILMSLTCFSSLAVMEIRKSFPVKASSWLLIGSWSEVTMTSPFLCLLGGKNSHDRMLSLQVANPEALGSSESRKHSLSFPASLIFNMFPRLSFQTKRSYGGSRKTRSWCSLHRAACRAVEWFVTMIALSSNWHSSQTGSLFRTTTTVTWPMKNQSGRSSLMSVC